jgi:hypothetical protein
MLGRSHLSPPAARELSCTRSLPAKGALMHVLADTTGGGYLALWTVIYVVLIVTIGLMTIRKGHWVMFLIGFFLPIFWLIGALMPRRVR